jgi:phosphotransferase system  glucose/maltose/N-acetylglucosamine-specific IIC component
MGDRYNIMRGAAYRKKGEDWRNAILAFELLVAAFPWLLLALVVGAGGWFAHRVWSGAGDAVTTGLPHMISTVGTRLWLWVLLVGLVSGIVGSVVSRSYNRWRNIRIVAVLTAVALVLLWVVSLFA